MGKGTTIDITLRTLTAVSSEAVERGEAVYAWDSKLRGFGVKASPKGTVSYLVQKWVGGRGGASKRIVIGHYPAWKLDKARTEAASIIGDVAKGIDIVDRKAKLRIARREALNATKLVEAVELYLKRHSTDGRYWHEVGNAFRGTDGHKGIVQSLGKDTTVASITKQEVRKLIDAKQDADLNGAARSLFAVLRPFFKWCVERDMIAVSPLADLKAPTPLEARDRLLSDDELKALWAASLTMSAYSKIIQRDPHPIYGAFYRMLLLTAQRREEVADMQWSEIDGSVWTIPSERTKNGKEHTVHLSPQAMAVLKTLERKEDCPYVFTTKGETGLSGFAKAKARLDKLMPGTPAWRVHDLRRTAASGMAQLGFQPHIIERVLNHVSGAQGGLIAVYQRYEYLEERKRALEAWGAYIETLVSKAPKANNVVSFSMHAL